MGSLSSAASQLSAAGLSAVGVTPGGVSPGGVSAGGVSVSGLLAGDVWAGGVPAGVVSDSGGVGLGTPGGSPSPGASIAISGTTPENKLWMS